MAVRRFGIKILLPLAVIAWTACSSDLIREDILPDKGCTLTVDATKSNATPDTRGLNPPVNNAINAIWSEGDQVTILSSSNNAVLGTMTPTSYGSNQTKLKATLISPVKRGDQLTLVFPRTGRDYTGQKGTLNDIASNYDYATATVTVNYANDSFVSATDAHFTNLQSIVRFTLKKTDNSDLPVKNLTIEANGLLQNGTSPGSITITPTDATSDLYAALSGINNAAVTLTATDDKDIYTYTTAGTKTFADGNFYRITAKMKKKPRAYTDPLTFECFDSRKGSVWATESGDLEYSKNGGEWKAYKSNQQITINKGDIIRFRGTQATIGNSNSSQFMQIKCNSDCYIYGNIMSLLSKDNFATMTELPYAYTFQNLFQGNTYIYHTEGKDLVLPATVLKKQCYYQMFNGCTNFNYIKCLATDIPANRGCTTNWLKGTPTRGTRTFVKAEGFEGWTVGDSGIPNGWTIEEE